MVHHEGVGRGAWGVTGNKYVTRIAKARLYSPEAQMVVVDIRGREGYQWVGWVFTTREECLARIKREYSVSWSCYIQGVSRRLLKAGLSVE